MEKHNKRFTELKIGDHVLSLNGCSCKVFTVKNINVYDNDVDLYLTSSINTTIHLTGFGLENYMYDDEMIYYYCDYESFIYEIERCRKSLDLSEIFSILLKNEEL